MKERVLFLCTHNSARSQMAEGLLRSMAGERFEVFSAGTEQTRVHPLAIEAMREIGIDISGHRSKTLDEWSGRHFDYVITVCDRANESCPIFPGGTERIHWSFDDPSAAATGTDEEKLQAFRRVRGEIQERLRLFQRPPTHHERMAGRAWDASYTSGEPAPWDVGRAQPAVERVAARGGFAGRVLDAGCGTGENTLLVASLGLRVVGIDVADTALAMAREKARERGIDAEFAAADALHLERLDRTFDTVLDCGLFHAFDGEERALYAKSLASVTARGGTLYVLCFSDEGAETGPHPVSRQVLRAAFQPAAGWDVVAIEAERVMTRFHGDDGAPAWLATVKRIQPELAISSSMAPSPE